GPCIGRTVAKEGNRDAALAVHLRGKSSPRHDRDASRHNPVGAQHTDFEIGNVHGPTLPLAVASLAAVDLGHHALEMRTLGDAVSMPTVGRDDLVTLLKGGAYPHRHRLLADVAVHDAVDLAGMVIGRRALLETADGLHLAQHGALLVGRKVHGRAPYLGSEIFIVSERRGLGNKIPSIPTFNVASPRT